MEDENRPDAHPEDDDADAGWYFDLPKGAWERQEAKNRELRQNVRRNMDDAEPKKDVFGAPIRDGFDLGDEPEDPEQQFEPADDAPGDERGAWAAARESSPAAASADWLRPRDERSEYSTEPEMESPNAFRLRSRRLQEDDEPKLKPPPGLFGFQQDEDAPVTGDEPGFRPAPGPRLAPRSDRAAETPERSVPTARGDAEPAAQGEHHGNRWDNLFGEKASEGASMLEGMRNWARSASHEPEPGHPDQLGAGEEPSHAEDRVPPASVTPEPLRVQRHDPDEPPLVNAENPQTRWDQMFGGKPADDAGLLEGMRSWAAKRDEEPAAPRLRLAPETDEVAEQLFEPFAWEAAEPPSVEEVVGASLEEPDPSEKKGLLGKLFGKKRKRDTALETPPTPAHNWFAEDEPLADDQSRGSWLGRSDGDETRFPASPAGREWVTEEEASRAALASGWALADEDPGAGPRFPRTESFRDEDPNALGDAANDADVEGDPLAKASWSPAPSVEDEERFSELSSWFANRNAQTVIGETMGAEEPASLATVPPHAVGDDEAEQFASADAEDDGWDPEPVSKMATTSADVPAYASADEESSGETLEWVAELDAEPHTADLMAAPHTDEDPWTPINALDAGDHVAAEAETPGVREAFDTGTEDETDDGVMPDVPFGVAARNPEAGLVTRPDDPWAMFVRGRMTDDAEATADGPGAEEAIAAPATAASLEPPDAPEAASNWDDLTGVLETDSAQSEGPVEEPASTGAPWDSAMAPAHDSEILGERDEDVAAAADDDPWALITRATGYEDAAADADWRPTAAVEPPAEPYEPESEYQDSYANAPGALTPSSSFAEELPAVSRPEWDDTLVHDDTVLRAFEAHASAFGRDEAGPVAPPPETDSLVFDDLLGEDAEDIVAEASQPSPEQRYFGRMQGWAPQRVPGERQPYPWEQDSQEPSRQPDVGEDEATGVDPWDGGDDMPPPWSTEPVAARAAHTEAPSVRRKSRSRVLVREIVETGLLALLVFLSVRASFQNFKVDGYSMWPTLDDGEYLIVNKLAYSEVDMDRLSKFVPFVEPGDDPTREVFGGPERGDIVVLKDPRETDTDLIKRIVGMPGETLEIVDGKVYINDMLLMEPYIKEEWHDDKPKIAIPDGYFFVMGDNRNNSMDSRSSQIGLIPQELVIGKAMLTYWPRNKFGLAPNESGDISAKDGRPVVTAERVEE